MYVLFVIGGSLLPHHSALLFQLACEMAREQSRIKRFSWEDAEGEISTRYTSACLGGVSGIVFSFTLEADIERRGSFIVRESDLTEEYDPEAGWIVVTSDLDHAANAMNN